MLEELNINNLGIVENTSLPFSKGLNVLTGETGAGKSMILNGLGLLLGGRAKTSMIGADQSQLTVEGCWVFDDTPSFIEERNATVEDGQLFVSRSVKSDGKSRAVVGGRSIPVSVLSEISSQLVSIHGQSDQLKLKSNTTQLKIVDGYGDAKISEALADYRVVYDEWIRLTKLLKEFQENSALKQQEREFYQEVLETFEKVDPQPGEDEELRQLISKLENVDAIREHMQKASQMLSSEEDEPDLMTLSYLLLNSVQSAMSMDEQLQQMGERVSRIYDEISDLSHDVNSYLHSVDYEAIASLNEAQERLSDLFSLNRKYGQEDLESSLKYYEKAVEWFTLNASTANIEELKAEVESARQKLKLEADKLTKLRTETASRLSSKMNEALSELNMGGAVFLIENYETDFTGSGQDTVEFMLKPHKNAEPNPVNKTASGGELSRIMLALETVTADTEQLTTFVFDEIDSGVGGETAVQIGKRLAELAKNAQVIVVTHLPQVASFADNHLLIQKTAGDESVSTTVKQLTEEERREEIARMLSGLNGSDTGLAHADELLEFAGKWKSR